MTALPPGQPLTVEVPKPPFSLEAEQGLLGALLLDNTGVWRRIEHTGVCAADFYDPVHQRLFAWSAEASRSGKMADGVRAASDFAADAPLLDLGGAAYLGTLVLQACDPAAAPDYAELVTDLALRRKLIDEGLKLARSAGQPHHGGCEALEASQRALAALETGSTYQPVSAAEAMLAALAEARAAKTRGAPAGTSTGLPTLDAMHGTFKPGELVVIAGRPGMGKSALALALARFIAAGGTGVAYLSLEMDAMEHGARLVTDIAHDLDVEVMYQSLPRGAVSSADLARLDRAADLAARMPLLFDDRGRVPFDRLPARIRALRRVCQERWNTPCKVVFVDHLGLLEPPRLNGGGRNRVEEVTHITGELKRIAREMGVTIVVLSQLNRKVEERQDKRPMLSDLRESGSIEQDANSVLLVFREAYYLEKELERLTAAGDGGTMDADRLRDRKSTVEQRLEIDVAKRRGGKGGRATFLCDIGLNVVRELPAPVTSPASDDLFGVSR
jgi:replicative DNA helicase